MRYTDEEISSELEKMSQGFMGPEVEWLNEDPDECNEDREAAAGWYCRLSAPGYLDCTDWSGPYATEREAAEAIIDMYGDE